MRRLSLSALGAVAALSLSSLIPVTQAADAVRFGTDWVPQAEHGGFYQALADGTYARYGLDVTIVPGGPSINNQQLLVDGQIEFFMGSHMGDLTALQSGIPVVTIASIFQKEPRVLIGHPEAGYTSLEQMASASKYLLDGSSTAGFFRWLKARYPAFTDDKVADYAFDPAPFIADPKSIHQGYLTSEPYDIEMKTGVRPTVFLIADAGYEAYSTTITAMKPWYEANKDVAKRFVEASILGWYNYLYGDNAAANALITAANPQMDAARLASSVGAMKAFGIVNSGDATEKGIGCFTAERWKRFYDMLVSVNVMQAGLDVSAGIDTSLVCQGLGKDLVK